MEKVVVTKNEKFAKKLCQFTFRQDAEIKRRANLLGVSENEVIRRVLDFALFNDTDNN